MVGSGITDISLGLLVDRRCLMACSPAARDWLCALAERARCRAQVVECPCASSAAALVCRQLAKAIHILQACEIGA
jgi:hypothetical protein